MGRCGWAGTLLQIAGQTKTYCRNRGRRRFKAPQLDNERVQPIESRDLSGAEWCVEGRRVAVAIGTSWGRLSAPMRRCLPANRPAVRTERRPNGVAGEHVKLETERPRRPSVPTAKAASGPHQLGRRPFGWWRGAEPRTVASLKPEKFLAICVSASAASQAGSVK